MNTITDWEMVRNRLTLRQAQNIFWALQHSHIPMSLLPPYVYDYTLLQTLAFLDRIFLTLGELQQRQFVEMANWASKEDLK